jgi:transcriptional regulator with XRE-family HTH domain
MPLAAFRVNKLTELANKGNRIITVSELFSQRFRQARQQAGLKATDLAEIMGVSRAYLSQIESGKRSNVSQDKLLLAAKALQTSVAQLLYGNSQTAVQPQQPDQTQQSDNVSLASLDKRLCAIEQLLLRLLAGDPKSKPSVAAGRACGAVGNGGVEADTE